MAEQIKPMQEIAVQLESFVANNNITATVTLFENQLTLNDLSNSHTPLRIIFGNNKKFHLKDTQNGFQGQVC